LSLTDENITEINIFPNPANRHIEVTGLSAASNIIYKIYDLTGRTVHNGQLAMDHRISVSDLREGLYVFQFNANNHRFTKRVIIKH
jgi:hypothetical protein